LVLFYLLAVVWKEESFFGMELWQKQKQKFIFEGVELKCNKVKVLFPLYTKFSSCSNSKTQEQDELKASLCRKSNGL
jgi:hypothetical protein